MTPTASEQVEPVVGPNTTIVIIQNGVGNADQFRERFPHNIVLSAVVSLPRRSVSYRFDEPFLRYRLGSTLLSPRLE
jgi:ketopantoate reductase